MGTTTETAQREIPRSEQIGSLLRPERLLKVLEDHSSFSRDVEGAIEVSPETAEADRKALDEVEDECIREAVERQIALGVDVLSDGEFRREFFMSSFFAALKGLAVDEGESTEFHDDAGGTTEVSGRAYAESRLEVGDNLAAREAKFLKEIAGDRPFKVTFPAASTAANPGAFKPGITDKYYDDPMQMALHMLQLERQLIDEAVAAGTTYVQMDYPAYVLWLDDDLREQIVAGAGMPADAILDGMIAADTMIVNGLPDHVHKALHLCRGNYKGKWMVKGSLEPVAERVFNLPYDRFLVEWDDEERMGDYSALRHVPKGPIVVMGLISSKSPELESEDEILRHIDEAGKYLDVDQLAISPQCGFASVAAGNPLSEDDQWRKLDLVSRVADRVWPR